MAEPERLSPQLTDAELWRAVEANVLDLLLPAIPEDREWARAAAVQLVALARYARSRPADPAADRTAELVAALDTLPTNEIVNAAWNGDRSEPAVLEAVGQALALAVGRHDPDADEVRRELRSIVVRHLDDELAVTAPLVAAFRGRLDG